MDDSFKKPGSIPFQWEIRPGVPKHQQKPINHSRPSRPLINLNPPPPGSSPRPGHNRVDSATRARPEIVEPGCFSSPLLKHQQKPINHNRPSHALSKLSPPPPGFNFPRPGHNRVDSPTKARPEVVESGCFSSKKRNVRSNTKSGLEFDYGSDFETMSSWSESTQKSMSVFSDMAFSSYEPSPCLFSDPDWVGFGLF